MALTPLTDTTEARYAEIARKMVELGDPVTLWHEQGVPFWGKPPLSIWFSAGAIKAVGLSEFAVRFPHFLAALGVLWIVWQWGRRHSDREAAIATAVLGGTSLFYVAAGAVMTDMALLVGLMLVMRGFWQALDEGTQRSCVPEILLGAGLACGLLAKGPVALVLVNVPIAAWITLTGNALVAWHRIRWTPVLLITLALTLPWYVMAERSTPGFLEYFLIGEHWERFTIPGWTGDRYGSAHEFSRGTIWVFAIAATMPWPILIPILLLSGRRSASVERRSTERLYLFLWGITPCAFFTTSGNILWTYVLPALPPLALLAASQLTLKPERRFVNALVAIGAATPAVVTLCAAVLFPDGLDRRSAKLAVAAYMKSGLSAPLVFFNTRPQSALFYSRGRARWAQDDKALATLSASSNLVVATRTTTLFSCPTSCRVLGVFGGYRLTLLQMNPPRTGVPEQPSAWPVDWPRPPQIGAQAVRPFPLPQRSGELVVTESMHRVHRNIASQVSWSCKAVRVQGIAVAARPLWLTTA